MMPTTGPKVSSRMIGDRVIDIDQHLRRKVRRSGRLRGEARSSISRARPRATASRTWARTASAAAVRTTGPSVVCGSSGDPSR